MYREDVQRASDYKQMTYMDLDEEELSVLITFFISGFYETSSDVAGDYNYIYRFITSINPDKTIGWEEAPGILFEYNEYMKNNEKLNRNKVKTIVPRKNLIDFI